LRTVPCQRSPTGEAVIQIHDSAKWFTKKVLPGGLVPPEKVGGLLKGL